MRKLLGIILSLLAVPALGQPGPPPSPFLQNGQRIQPQSSNSCLTMPSAVSGGCTGAGTINATGLYVDGVVVTPAGTLSPSTTVSGITSGYVLYNNAGNLGGIATTGTGNVVLSANPHLTGSVGIGTTNPRTALELAGVGVSLSITSTGSAANEKTWDIFAFENYLSFRRT